MRFSIKQQTLFLLGLTAILFVAVGITIIIPSVRRIQNLKKDIEQTQLYLERQYQRTQRLRRSTHEIAEVEEKIQEYSGAIIRSGEELSLITEFERLSGLYNVDQTLMVNFFDGKNSGRPYYTFSFLNNAAFTDHVRYLKALEDLPYYIVINSLRFEKRQLRAAGGSPITLSFDAAIYTD